MGKKVNSEKKDDNYIVLNGKKLMLREHPTDFSALATESDIKDKVAKESLKSVPLARKMTRLTTSNSEVRDNSMKVIREKMVAHHIYQVEGTEEEVVIDDRIFLRLHRPDPADLEAIMDTFNLSNEGRMGDTYVLKVTNATGKNPVKTANEIAKRAEVLSCSPQVLIPIQKHQHSFADTHVLFREQWYLIADLINNIDVNSGSDIKAPESWQITMGDSEVVLAVMDDGFDLGHPAFHNKQIHSAARDFADPDSNPIPGTEDFHGTPVASIATGSADGDAMIGVAPGCTFLPIRIGFGLFNQFETLQEFGHASLHADVLNCSFGFPPLTFDFFDSGFRQAMTEMTRTGGRRGKGLVIVFSAGNDDAPTRLRAADNRNGVRFLGRDNFGNFLIRAIPAGRDVFSAYPSIEGIVVVAAMSSRLRKSGYSNWGEHITVTAPSSNGHELGSITDFSANYRGLGQIGAVNRPGHGSQSRPLIDDPTTPNVRENWYTDEFGGTSGAAPVVSGVAALMISANPDLTAADVQQILMSTADKNLDSTPDLPNDPNLQGLTGEFVNGRSLFFGSGKVDAFEAVNRAKATGNGGGGIVTGNRHGSASPGLSIPDNRPAGVVSHIDIPGVGSVENITVTVDITHTYQGDLNVTLISPERIPAVLHQVFEGGGTDDLKHTYTASNKSSLKRLVDGGVEGGGRWALHVSDNLNRDTGSFNTWSLDLRN